MSDKLLYKHCYISVDGLNPSYRYLKEKKKTGKVENQTSANSEVLFEGAKYQAKTTKKCVRINFLAIDMAVPTDDK